MRTNVWVFMLVLGFILLASTQFTLDPNRADSIIFSLLFYFSVLLLALAFMWLASMGYYSVLSKKYSVIGRPTLESQLPEYEEPVRIEAPEQKLLPSRIPEPVMADPDFIRMIENAIN